MFMLGFQVISPFKYAYLGYLPQKGSVDFPFRCLHDYWSVRAKKKSTDSSTLPIKPIFSPLKKWWQRKIKSFPFGAKRRSIVQGLVNFTGWWEPSDFMNINSYLLCLYFIISNRFNGNLGVDGYLYILSNTKKWQNTSWYCWCLSDPIIYEVLYIPSGFDWFLPSTVWVVVNQSGHPNSWEIFVHWPYTFDLPPTQEQSPMKFIRIIYLLKTSNKLKHVVILVVTVTGWVG